MLRCVGFCFLWGFRFSWSTIIFLFGRQMQKNDESYERLLMFGNADYTKLLIKKMTI